MWRNTNKWIKFQLIEEKNKKWAQDKHQERNKKMKINNSKD